MKRLFSIPTVLLLTASSVCLGQTLKAKLVDYTPDKMPPSCGLVAAATTLKFEVVENVGSFKQGQHLLVAIICPWDQGGNLYENGDTFALTLYRNPKKERGRDPDNFYNMHYNYDNERLPRYWCKTIQVAR